MFSAAIRPRSLLALVCGASLLLLLSAAPVGASDFTVNTTVDSIDVAPGDGVCADANGTCSVRAAVMEANGLVAVGSSMSNTITIPPGTYALAIAGRGENAAATGDLDANGGALTIIGAGDGVTILDGGGLDRLFHLGPVTATPVQFSLHGVTVQNGNAVSEPPNLGTSGPDIGGGIRIELNSGLHVTNATFQGNHAGARGGAMGMPPTAATVVGADPAIITELTNVTMAGNTAGVEAGGIFNNRNALLENVRITNNRVTGTVGNERGGGIANSGHLTLTNSTVNGNSLGAGSGGGIGNRGDPAANIFGTIVLNNTTISNNFAELGGGIANGNGATANLTNTTISGNRAFPTTPPGVQPRPGAGAAGGLVNGGAATLTNVTIAGNRAGAGSAVFTAGPPLGAGNARTTLASTILVSPQNASPNCVPPNPGIPFARLPVSAGYNISGDNSCFLTGPGDLNGVNPHLGLLANNGGPTQTHALRRGSPAIDHVPLGACAGVAHDQRGVARPQDGNADGVTACDTGAYELVLTQLNAALVLTQSESSYDAADARAPGGVCTVTATFQHTGEGSFFDVFLVVRSLSGSGSVLLNRDAGTGEREGAQLSVTDVGADGVLSPGESFTQEFEIGLRRGGGFNAQLDVFGTNAAGGGGLVTDDAENVGVGQPEKIEGCGTS